MYLENTVCTQCGKNFLIGRSAGRSYAPDVCLECRKIRDDAALKAHLDELEKLGIDARLKRIETLLYQNPPHNRHHTVFDMIG